MDWYKRSGSPNLAFRSSSSPSYIELPDPWPLGEVTQLTYDGGDHILTRVLPAPEGNGQQPPAPFWQYTYDLVGNIASITTPKGYTTTYTRPGSLNSVTITDPANNTAVVNFDANARASTYTDKNGDVTTYTYDNLGRLKKFYTSTYASYCVGTTPWQYRETDYAYDTLDRVTQMTDTDGDCQPGSPYNTPLVHTQKYTYTYDGVDNVLSEAQTTTQGTALQPPSSIAYTYDPNSRQTSTALTVNGSAQPTINYVYDCADELVDMSNGGALNSSSCSSSNYVNDCPSDGSQVGFCYDGGGRRVSVISMGIKTQYAYNNGGRLQSITYSNQGTGHQFGNLTYGYDQDAQVNDLGGSLAGTLLTAAATASYSSIDQVQTWNNNTAQVGKRGNIGTDPSNGNLYTWDIRNELSGENSSATIQYDAFGRRENLPTGFSGSGGGQGIPAVSLYDGGQTIQNIGSATVNYLRDPESGEMLMESWNGTNNIPLLDASGSTVAMVDAATGNITTNYTYDPLGSAAVTGTGYQTAYQFRGLENDSWAYYGLGHYYSPIMGRSLSSTAPLTAPGGYDSGLAGVVSAAMPGSGSDAGYNPINLTAFEIGAGTFAATEAFDFLIAADLSFGETNPGTALPAAVVAAIAEAIYEIFDIFGIFGNGHPYIPPLTRFELKHQGGSPAALGGLVGMYPQWATGQGPSAGVVLVDGPARSSPPTRQTAKSSMRCKGRVIGGCAFDFSHLNAALGLALAGCAEGSVATGPLAPPSFSVCAGVAGGVMLPPLSALDYLLIRNCVQEFKACGKQ